MDVRVGLLRKLRPKNWCFCTVVLEKTLENPLDCKIKPVNPKGNQPWIFIGRTDAEAEISILWPPDVKNWLIWKDPDAGKDWRQEEKGITEEKKNLSYLLKSGSCRCLLNTAKRDEAGSQAAAGITVCTKVYPISWCMDGQCSFWEAWHMVLVSKIPKRYFLFWMKGKF